jgi:hypothetical protein
MVGDLQGQLTELKEQTSKQADEMAKQATDLEALREERDALKAKVDEAETRTRVEGLVEAAKLVKADLPEGMFEALLAMDAEKAASLISKYAEKIQTVAAEATGEPKSDFAEAAGLGGGDQKMTEEDVMAFATR